MTDSHRKLAYRILNFAPNLKFGTQKMTKLLTKADLISPSAPVTLNANIKLSACSIMALSNFYILTLCVCLGCLIAQLFVKQKKLPHILFAIFCGSVAMSLTQKVTGDAIGAYKYLIGLGTVATCNCYWLLSRSLFRQQNVIERHHLALAFAISLLIFINQGYLFASSSQIIASSSDSVFRHVLSEITVLLSSCVLVLSFWEGCRGFKTATKYDKVQRIVFLSTFGLAVGISKLTSFTLADNADAKEWVITAIILMVVVNTQLLLAWRVQYKRTDSQPKPQASTLEEVHTQPEPVCDIDTTLAREITTLINEGSLYLQANLKVADIARSLDVPEYRVSRALKSQITDKNFNQYINSLRIEHAKSLLANPENQGWSVLVISLESGFASIGPFTRAFKAETGQTPNQFRQMHLSNDLVKAS